MNTQTVLELKERFGIDEVFDFSENEHGSIKATINTKTCEAEVYLQGAHLTQWRPTGQRDVLFLSERSLFQTGKAIRGGVPLIFPWFGPRSSTDGKAAPSHGFARTSNDWVLIAAGLSKDDFSVTFELTENEISKSFGYSDFKVTYKIGVGEELELELIVENNSHEILNIEEAFHTYLGVSDVEKVDIHGLNGAEFLDKTDNFKRKKQTENSLRLQSATDRCYLNTGSKVEVIDNSFKRKILVDKLGSNSTVVWNPWDEQTAKLDDMQPAGWRQMLCVETANVNENTIAIPPGSHHAMHARIKVSPL